MKSVKLLTLTSLSYVLMFTLITLGCFSFFFVIIQQGIRQSTDEALVNRKVRILREFRQNRQTIPTANFQLTDVAISPEAERKIRPDVYSDTLIFEPLEQENYLFRKLTTVTQLNGQFHRLDIVLPSLENEEIIHSLIKIVSLVFALMVSTFFLTSLFFSKKLWQSFYSTLAKLNTFEIDRSTELHFPPSRIKEFTALNQSISALTVRARHTFNNQKQFIENAAHELQTPLAINQNKLEQLAGDPNLTHEQSLLVQILINSTQRMSRLNKTLLLMAKIENEQFLEAEPIRMAPLLEDILSFFDDQHERKQIAVSRQLDRRTTIVGNKSLIELLLTNLIKNAFVHNHPGGSIWLTLTTKELTIANTSTSPAIPDDKLFQRFYKNTNRKESWGLGLALVHKICTLNKWPIRYAKEKNRHSFTVIIRN